jgi:hypothetical protein
LISRRSSQHQFACQRIGPAIQPVLEAVPKIAGFMVPENDSDQTRTENSAPQALATTGSSCRDIQSLGGTKATSPVADAENPTVSEQTIKALAGHVSRQMLERYSHIRSAAKEAAIQALEHDAIEPILPTTGHKIGHREASGDSAAGANSQKTNSGPGRIRTYDQRIMSPLL